MRYAVALLLATICACNTANEDPAPEPVEEEIDLCEQAALHRAECVGNYATPPTCDAAAEAGAQEILDTPCEDFEELSAQGKADGALCDWFGLACTPDEPIFIGPPCSTDADCAAGSSCIEEKCFEGVGSEDFAVTLDLFTETQEVTGADTQLLMDNDETRQVRRDLVEQATESIHFSAFLIEDDEVGDEMVELFSAAARRGVEVRVIIDATTQYAENYEIMEKLAQAGVEVLSFNPLTEWAVLRVVDRLTANDRLHEKVLVVDGKEVVMGGRNVGGHYLTSGAWRDADVYVAGKGVESIQRMFLSDWDRIAALEVAAGCDSQANWGFACPPEPLVDTPLYYPEQDELGTSKTRAILSNPHGQETPLGYFTYLSLIRGARKSITISNAYFVPPQRMRKHLKAAIARGVKVRVVTNSKTSTDQWWMYYASINYYKELIDAGLEIYEFGGTQTLHSKVMLIDDELAVVGSYNLDPRSAVDNSESVLLIRESEAVEQVRQALEEDVSSSTAATADFSWSEIAKARSLRLIEPLL